MPEADGEAMNMAKGVTDKCKNENIWLILGGVFGPEQTDRMFECIYGEPGQNCMSCLLYTSVNQTVAAKFLTVTGVNRVCKP